MALKKFKKDGDLYDEEGAFLTSLHSDDNKNFAVIVKCGHCGRGYFIPIMFSIYCKDIYTAIERIKAIPRVKHDQKDVVIDAFEITQTERYLIKAINDHDPYLKGYFDKDSPELHDRRLLLEARLLDTLKENRELSEEELIRMIKTADSFDESKVLQRYYAPVYQGGDVFYPKRINRAQMLEDYFTQSTIRLGIKKADNYFLTNYYQIYGKNNKLGLVFNNGWFTFKGKDGKLHSIVIEDVYLEKLFESGVFERDKQLELEQAREIELENETKTKKPSAIDKFNKRMSKYRSKQEESKPKQMGE